MVFDPERRQVFGGEDLNLPLQCWSPSRHRPWWVLRAGSATEGRGKPTRAGLKPLKTLLFFFPFYFYLPGLEPKVLASPREMKQFSTNNIYVQGL